MKRSELMKIVTSINAAAKVAMPWKINYAMQRTLAKLEPEHRAITKTIDAASMAINDRMANVRKEYADQVKDKDGNDIPLVKEGKYITTIRESELSAKLSDLSKELTLENEKISEFLEEEIDVEIYKFSVSEEDEKKLENLSGSMLQGLLPLIN